MHSSIRDDAKDDDGDDINDAVDDTDDAVDLAGGMLECKLDEYHIYQTIAEMIKSAGDMVAKSLVDGHLVRHTDIYGLAINYDTDQPSWLH